MTIGASRDNFVLTENDTPSDYVDDDIAEETYAITAESLIDRDTAHDYGELAIAGDAPIGDALRSLRAAFARSGAALDRRELYRAVERFKLGPEAAARLQTEAENLGLLVEAQLEVLNESIEDLEAEVKRTNQDVLGALISRVKRTPVFNHAQQLQLLRTIRAGWSAEKMLLNETPSMEDRSQVRRMATEGRRAFERFVTSNIRLVITVAREHMRPGLDFEDVIQEGTFGLIRAIELFDASQGLKFSTYAYHWIRNKIQRAFENQSRTIRFPSHLYQLAGRVAKARDVLFVRFGREPTMHELAEHVGDKPEKVLIIWQMGSLKSLDAPLQDADDFVHLSDVIASEDDNVLREVLHDEERDVLDSCLGRLSAREADVVRRRFGLIDGRQYTLEQIGIKYNVTRERIRQVEDKALRKLRKMKDLNHLWSHNDDVDRFL